MRGSDVVIKMLIAHEVKHVFGVPGDTSMNFHDSFSKFSNQIQHILCRDERNASFMADAYARVSGKPGVVEVPSGGGALYAVPGISEANISSIPLICLSSDITMSSEETNALTDANQEHLYKPITKWNTKIRLASKIPHLFRKGFRLATGGIPGAVHISIPENILGQEVEISAEEINGAQYTGYHTPFSNMPRPQDIEISITMFKNASKPVIISGGGLHLSGAYSELQQFVDNFKVPVATSVNGKGSIEEYSPYSIGVIGANGGAEESLRVVQEADLVLVLGSKLNNVTTMGKTAINKKAKIIQVDIGEEALGANISVDIPIMCDIKCYLQQLNSAMIGEKTSLAKQYKPWNKWVNIKIRDKRKRIDSELKKDTQKVYPPVLIDVLEKLTHENTVFVGDAGTPTPYLASYFRIKKAGRQVVLPRGHGGLGYALPAAIGAQIARPDAQVISMFGDGSFGMALGDLETAKRLNLPIVFINLENNSYGWIKTIQKLYYDENYFAVDFSPIDTVKIAEGFGLKAKNIDKNSQLEDGLKWALKQQEPVFLNIEIEPPTETVPPVLKWEKDSRIPASERKKLTY